MSDKSPYLDEDGQIPFGLVDDLLVEVVSGKYMFRYEDELYASRQASQQETERGRVVYAKTMHKALMKGLMTRDQLEKIGLQNDLFDMRDRNERAELKKMLERWAKARDMTQDMNQRLKLDKEMDVARQKILDLELKEMPLYRNAAETFALEAKNDYLVSCCSLGGDMLDVPIWANWDEYQNCADWGLIVAARNAHHRMLSGLPNVAIRALSRTGEWRMKWKACTESGAPPFDEASSNWDRNKRNLIYWSNFYDQIYKHPDCPDEETIADDDALQSWLNYQVMERNKAKAQQNKKRPPSYKVGGQHRQMTQIGQDKVMRVNQPYKIRTNS